MRIVVVRNATIENNASMHRTLDAIEPSNEAIIISRNRDLLESKERIIHEKYEFNKNLINHYKISIPSERGAGMKNILSLLLFQLSLFKVFFKLRKKIDVIHSYDLDTGLISLLVSKLFKVKLVYHIADFYTESRQSIPEKLKGLVKRLEFQVINYSDVTIICTEQRKEQIVGSKPKRLEVIHNTPMVHGSDMKILKDIKVENINYLKICYIGTLAETRFIKELVNAAIKNEKIELTIGGIGQLNDWLIEISKVYKNIKFLGRLNYRDTFSIYAKNDIIAAIYNPEFNNHKYSAPNKLYEAMLLGRPIIVVKGTGQEDFIIENNIGFVIDYSLMSMECLADYLLTNREILTEKSRNMEKIYEFYSWRKMKKKYRDIYNTI